VTATRWQYLQSDGAWVNVSPHVAADVMNYVDSAIYVLSLVGAKPIPPAIANPIRLYSPPCDLCGRAEGSRAGRHGEPVDPLGGELGPVKVCEVCGRVACPECYAESVCCGSNH
jgi:hypothetical protein